MSSIIIVTINAIINAGFFLSVESASIMWAVPLPDIERYWSENDQTLYPCYHVDNVVFCQSGKDTVVLIVQ